MTSINGGDPSRRLSARSRSLTLAPVETPISVYANRQCTDRITAGGELVGG
jgi:hypothetical protein